MQLPSFIRAIMINFTTPGPAAGPGRAEQKLHVCTRFGLQNFPEFFLWPDLGGRPDFGPNPPPALKNTDRAHFRVTDLSLAHWK